MNTELESVMNAAHLARKGDWRAYSDLVRKLDYIPFKPGEHDEARRDLIRILEV